MANYRLVQEIKDTRFDTDRIAEYDLFLQIGKGSFRMFVADLQQNRCLWLGNYEMGNNPETSIEQLEMLYEEHPILKAGFWKDIYLSFRNSKFTLIPLSLFRDDCLHTYLHLTAPLQTGENAYFYKHTGSDIVNVFAADASIAAFIGQQYPTRTVRLMHHTSPLIEGALRFADAAAVAKQMFLHVEADSVTVLVTHGKKLDFCNIFPYTNDTDFTYFVMFVFEEMNMNPEKDLVTLWGELMPDSAIYSKLQRYIRHLKFGQRPASLTFAYPFDEVLDHRHLDLFYMYLCR